MSKYKMEEGKLFVEIAEITQEENNLYYKVSGEFKSKANTESKPHEFKTAKILHTFDEERYPINSEWIMGESPGIKINYRGEKLIEIQTRDLHARITK